MKPFSMVFVLALTLSLGACSVTTGDQSSQVAYEPCAVDVSVTALQMDATLQVEAQGDMRHQFGTCVEVRDTDLIFNTDLNPHERLECRTLDGVYHNDRGPPKGVDV